MFEHTEVKMSKIKFFGLVSFLLITNIYSQGAIEGRITDEAGLPVSGANIYVKNSDLGSISDDEGYYKVTSIPTGEIVLIVDFIGYERAENITTIVSDETKNLDISLTTIVLSGQEVVVVGYGSQRKSQLTGAVASISTEELTKGVAASLDYALQGKAAGVYVYSNSATPGGGVSVRIRGAGGINNSEPLYVIDGVPLTAGGSETNSPLSSINPQDIQSISILKDAASAGIYGARAANGVILITTKRGKGHERPTLSYSASYGSQSLSNTTEMMDAATYAEFINMANENAGLSTVFTNPASFGKGTDWMNVISRTAAVSNENISFSGGNESENFYLSLGRFKQDGVVIGSSFERISIRVNADKKISDQLIVGSSINLSRTKQDAFGASRETNNSPITHATLFYPTIPVYDSNGDYSPTPANGFYKPKANPLFVVEGLSTPPKVKGMRGNVFAEYKILPNLNFKTSGSYTYGNTVDENIGRIYDLGAAVSTEQSISKSHSTRSTWLIENTLNYKYISGIHNVNIIAGQSAEEFKGESLFASGEYDQQGHRVIEETAANLNLTNFIQEYTLASYFGRVNYGFKGKYLITANIRYDGSSKFGSNNRWGLFPAISAAWNISHEDFFPKEAFVNTLKLRMGWGQVGNDDIGNYSFSSNVVSNYGYGFGNTEGSRSTGSAVNSIPNPDVKWETVTQYSIGVDAELLDRKLSIVAEYYNKNHTDMLIGVPQSAVTGLSNGLDQGTIIQNIAELTNKGIEFSANYSGKIGKISYNVGTNVTTIDNKVIEVGPGGKILSFPFKNQFQTRTEEGRELGEFYGWVADGIFQSQSEVTSHAFQSSGTAAGDIRFKDLNGDNVIDESDKTFTGSPIPDFVYGFNLNLEYNNFDFSVQANGSQGNEILNLSTLDFIDNTRSENKMNFTPWSSSNTDSKWPRAHSQDPNFNTRPSSYFVEDGSYLRIKVIQLGYTFTSDMLGLNMSGLRIYGSIQNPITITKYSGVDPEVGNADGNNLISGIDHFVYPISRTFSVGINYSF